MMQEIKAVHTDTLDKSIDDARTGGFDVYYTENPSKSRYIVVARRIGHKNRMIVSETRDKAAEKLYAHVSKTLKKESTTFTLITECPEDLVDKVATGEYLKALSNIIGDDIEGPVRIDGMILSIPFNWYQYDILRKITGTRGRINGTRLSGLVREAVAD